MNTKQKLKKTALVKAVRRDDPYLTLGAARVESDKFWRWGDDNLFPAALALMARRSVTHRRIINDKADYISGKGFTCDEVQQPRLAAFLRHVNGDGESLRQVLNKLAFDKALFGNAFLEIVTDAEHSFLAFHHQDASRCRVARDSKHVLLHHDWAAFKPAEARSLPLGGCDVAVCDGFTGNVILKLTEGVAKMLLGMLKGMFLKNLGGKLAYLLLKESVSDLKHQMDSEEYGGAPFLGAKQPVIKAHGSSKAKGIKNAIRQAKICVENDLCGTMQSALDELTTSQAD